ncbi:MAG: type III pantothenate kinase [Nitrospinae bacterium]|nr:type III pantothenate kinase [Nitrospinota bacterium]
MLLAIDVGNSNNVIGLFLGDKLLTHWRIRTEWNRTADEYWVLIKEFIVLNKADAETIDAIVISCVVPPLIPILEEMSRKYFSCVPLIVGPGIKTGLPILYRNPAEVGADRIVNAVAGFEKYGGPLIIVDFGTATTFDAVSKKGEYLGGAIFPGVQISLEALFRNTAKLPRVDLTAPGQAIGKSTVESIQSGAVYGFVGMIDSMVTRFRGEMGQKARAIATGGNGQLIASKTETIDIFDPFLTLDGLRILHEKNRPSLHGKKPDTAA